MSRSCDEHKRHVRACADCRLVAYRHDAFAAQKEGEFASAVEDAFRLWGWRFTHFRPGMKANGRWVTALTGDKGWPDYFAVKGERALAVELKREGEHPTDEQWAWLYALRGAGIEAIVLRPSGFDAFVRDISGRVTK